MEGQKNEADTIKQHYVAIMEAVDALRESKHQEVVEQADRLANVAVRLWYLHTAVKDQEELAELQRQAELMFNIQRQAAAKEHSAALRASTAGLPPSPDAEAPPL